MASVNQAMQGQAQPVQMAPVAIEPAPKAVAVGGEKKSIWTRWWLWALIVLVVAMVVVFLII